MLWFKWKMSSIGSCPWKVVLLVRLFEEIMKPWEGEDLLVEIHHQERDWRVYSLHFHTCCVRIKCNKSSFCLAGHPYVPVVTFSLPWWTVYFLELSNEIFPSFTCTWQNFIKASVIRDDIIKRPLNTLEFLGQSSYPTESTELRRNQRDVAVLIENKHLVGTVRIL